MPLVRIDLLEGKSLEYIQSIAQGVHQALIDAIKIPADDRFQIITEHKKHQLIIDKKYLNIERTDDAIIVHVTLKAGRTHELKKNFYRSVVENLMKNPGLRKEDIIILLTENDAGDWSFGNGIAQYL